MKRQLIIIFLISLVTCGCSDVVRQQRYNELISNLKVVIPTIDEDFLFSDCYKGIQWIIFCRVEPLPSACSVKKKNWNIMSYVIQASDITRPYALAVVTDRVFINEPLMFYHCSWSDTAEVTESAKRKIVKSKEICNELIIKQVPDMYFVGAGWHKGYKLWDISESVSKYTCDFYLIFYYKLMLFQLVHVDDETSKLLRYDVKYTHIYENWYIRRYLWTRS